MLKKRSLFFIIILSYTVNSSLSFATGKQALSISNSLHYQKLLDELVSSKHIPCAVLLVDTPQKRFLGSAGYSDKINKIKMPSTAVCLMAVRVKS